MLTKTNFWRISVLVLLLLNITLVVYFSRQPERPHRRDELKNFVIERLHFDAAQTTAYQKLIERHRAGIRSKDQEIREAKQRLYTSLQGDDFSKKDSLIQLVGHLHTEIEEFHFEHFLEVKKLCRPEQMEDFQAVAKELARFLSPRRQAGEPRK